MSTVVPHVHLLPNSMAGNTYLLAGEALTLVDTGMPGNDDKILDYVREIGHRPEDVARIVLTHYHVDHVGSAMALREQTGAAVLAHRDDTPFIDGGRRQPPPQGGLFSLLYRILPVMSTLKPVEIDEELEDGRLLDILGGARVVHMPGHTPGAIALHLLELGVLLCGDAIGNRKGVPGPPPPAFTVDVEQAVRSIRKVAELEFDVLCPGHGPPIVGGASDQVRALATSLG